MAKRVVVAVMVAMLAFVGAVRGEFIIDLRIAGQGNDEAVIFPFDSYVVLLRKGLEMSLISSELTRNTEAHYNPIMTRGKAGAPDSLRIGYYGTVLEIDGQYRMWYIADGDHDEMDWEKSTPYKHIVYATSADGFHWEKPDLGLVEYAGSKHNNLVQTNFEKEQIYRTCTVLYEPAAEPQRRYKLYFEGKEGNRANVAFSADGLVWQPSQANPVTPAGMESTGLIKRDGMYYAVGQSGGYAHRVLIEYASPDFEHWTDVSRLGFRRDTLPPQADIHWGASNGPQVHLGAGFWDRGNVLIGLYGQWNGDPTDTDRRSMKMNLGLITSVDGTHFEEPVRDFKMIRSDEENWGLETMGSPPRITQGQGFINVGEKTITYYGHWGKDGNKDICAAVWERDRLGQFAINHNAIEGQRPASRPATDASGWKEMPCFVTCPIALPEGGGQVFLNCGNMTQWSELRVAVLDRNFEPMAGFTMQDCEPVTKDGFRVAVRWKGQDRVTAKGPVRLRVQWGGLRFEDPIVYAAYVAARK